MNRTKKSYIKLKMHSYSHIDLMEGIENILVMCKNLKLETSQPVSLPTKKFIFTILRSIFTHKDSKEHMGIRTYSKFIYIYFLNKQKDLDNMNNILNLKLPMNVFVEMLIKNHE